ncbi:glycosyltransferase family 2 protein [Microbulbifer sp. Q7]|uniref:glycosyltransferase family 2 protein n=1 Tax=Microbulbifer sp. Q7 TaxID=1785091 RepID=UPI001D10527F|nr:glycosyltransferase family 2 protein [Microbulbifer sp. Q7]
MVNLLKSLFRQDLVSHLEPVAAVEPAGSEVEGCSWRSLADKPLFAVRARVFRPGWYMLELQLTSTISGVDAELLLDAGNGFVHAETITLPLRNGRVAKRIVYFPARVHALGLSLLAVSDTFSVDHFRLVRLAPCFAQDRLARRLSNMHPMYRGQSKAQVISRIRGMAEELGQNWRHIVLERYAETFVRRKHDRDYQRWIDHVEPGLQSSACGSIDVSADAGPLISILLPTFNADIVQLQACIDSVLNQCYPHWQLCIADDASTDLAVHDCLLSYQARDSRIQVTLRETNGHIALATSSALELAQGDFVTFLDQDDTLATHALARVIRAIGENPEALLIYSDEDKMDEDGQRFDPHFKPDWNPDLLLSQNYICHLAVYRAELIKQAGAFRAGAEGSQDHDLLLRCLPQLNARNVVHIPDILYHWRAAEGSTALAGSNKAYAIQSGMRAVADYLEREGLPAQVGPGIAPNTYKLRWSVPKPAPLVSLLVPTRDGYEILKPCVDAILARTEYPNFELLILDNGSKCPATLSYLEEVGADPRVSVHRWEHPFNYSAINNFGAGEARGEILGLINNDIEPINSDWLCEMVGQVCRPEIGCVGAKLYYPNDTIQHGGVILGIGGVAGHAHKYYLRHEYGYFSRLYLTQNLSAVTGACLVLRKSVFEQVGGLNEADLAIAYNDVDLCLKVREAGYRNLWTPYAELYHHESVSRGADDTIAKRRRAQREADYMRKRWGDQLDTDPAYNPNLTLIHEDFSLA